VRCSVRWTHFHHMYTPISMNAAIPQPRNPSEEIAGLVERVTFFNEESGFAVLRVKVRGQRDLVTVLGSLPSTSTARVSCGVVTSWRKLMRVPFVPAPVNNRSEKPKRSTEVIVASVASISTWDLASKIIAST